MTPEDDAISESNGTSASAEEEPRAADNGPDVSAGNPAVAGATAHTADALIAERDQLKDQLLRIAADFDNFRKRSRREIEDAERQGRGAVLREVLPVIDNLERAVEAAKSAKDPLSVAEGVHMVLRQFEEISGKIGLERIPAAGHPFDPNLHEAVQQVETEDQPPGSIVSEVVPGYRLGDRLLRAAMVVVARAPAIKRETSSSDAGE